MILYTIADENREILNFLEADVKAILFNPEQEYAFCCNWCLVDQDGELYPASDIVRMEIDPDGTPHTGLIPDSSDPLFKEENATPATFKDGETVIFDTKGMAEEFDYPDEEAEKSSSYYVKKVEDHHLGKATIQCLATYTEIGNKDSEYYDIICNIFALNKNI